jgi:hypothetical protein
MEAKPTVFEIYNIIEGHAATVLPCLHQNFNVSWTS